MPVHKPSFLQDGFNSFAALVNCTDRHIHRRDVNKQANMKMRFEGPTEDILSCLRRVSTGDLLFAMMNTLSYDLLDLWKSFGVVIDDDNAGSDGIFFPDRTSLLLKSGRFTQVPVILGKSFHCTVPSPTYSRGTMQGQSSMKGPCLHHNT